MKERYESFAEPSAKYRVYPMTHAFPEGKETALMDAIKDYGFGGVVTNVPHENGFTGNPENLERFSSLVKELGERGLDYWIYDENGYPSGYAGGETLVGHPELEAKGLYMHRKVAYVPRRVRYCLDDESDKIVYAVKYPFDPDVRMDNSYIMLGKAVPVPHTETLVECELEPHWALFIFVVKPAYEGSHCTHNVCSFSRYINIMNPAAVKRFIDLCFEPIAKTVPDAFERAGAVFTDEPSLQVGYARDYESWPYALAPWEDGLLDAFEKEYGFRLENYLPCIFEPVPPVAGSIRVKFYHLVGKLIARAYSGQLSDWCRAHGGRFSGHYLAEESMVAHVQNYGDYMEVVGRADYPGLDVLSCYPECYDYRTAKHVEMLVRKKKTNGSMVEICPFYDIETFNKNPIENMTGVMNLLYLAGVRRTNSYFGANYGAARPDLFPSSGYLDGDQARRFNAYVGRLGAMLDNLRNDCETFIYYGVEDVQAKLQPSHTQFIGKECEADISTERLLRAVYESGSDFEFIDRADIADAVNSLASGVAEISGSKVRNILVPALDVMYDEALEGLIKLREHGVNVFFLDKLPSAGTELQSDTKRYTEGFNASGLDEILTALAAQEKDFAAVSDGAMILKARFRSELGDVWFVVNNSRAAASVRVTASGRELATLCDPETGETREVSLAEPVEIPSFRGVFFVLDR